METLVSQTLEVEGAVAGEDQAVRLADLRRVIEYSCQLLPAQGPITAFAFLNTLEGLEDVPFDTGVRRGAALFKCEPYYPETRYRTKLARGRISREDLEDVLLQDLAERQDGLICALGTRYHLRLNMLLHELPSATGEELEWFISETDALSRFRPDVPREERDRYIEESRHWLLRQRAERNFSGPIRSGSDKDEFDLMARSIERAHSAHAENWTERQWETLALEALWDVCRHGATVAPVNRRRPATVDRHRDLLLKLTGEDSDALISDVLIRYCAAFSDQGFARWILPTRDRGYFRGFLSLYDQRGGPPDHWLGDLRSELSRIESSGMSPLESLLESLDALGIAGSEWEDMVPATLFALRGWAGILWQMDVRSDRVPIPAPPGTVIEFLAVRLILERLALAHMAREQLGFTGPLTELRSEIRPRLPQPSPKHELSRRAFTVFQLAQISGWLPQVLARMCDHEWQKLFREIEDFPELDRRKIFHLAFERGYRQQALDAISVVARRPVKRVARPKFQIAFCIDAREEGFRRHLEEIEPDVETYGAAGFYSVPIYYRGAADAHFTTLCPIVVRPQYYLVEDVVYSLAATDRQRAKTRRALGAATHRVHVGTRGLASGAVITGGLGVLASIPLVLRVLFPRLTARLRGRASELLAPPRVTRLRLERSTVQPGPDEDQVGFTFDEMVNFGERVLRDVGLTTNFARLVIWLGHASFCLNNPHKSAYDCGACSGSPGGPNARALAAFLNDRRVREALAGRGLHIPAETWFLGGQHNTCTDVVSFYDLDLLPRSHQTDFEAAYHTLEKTGERNAHERCRRFMSAPLHLTFSEAFQHVEERSQDLAQTRPEFGNASNAVTYVGRRERIRGLFMDRRAFQHTYDPTQDTEDSMILARIFSAVVPVCSGINLQYYFSSIDSPGWGCGTKLPHNVTSLLGVMDGASSDLRSGLPWQGVEIHEPMRSLFVIESTPKAMLSIMERNPVVGRILRNGWAILTVLDPHSDAIQVYQEDEFVPYRTEKSELPRADTSTDWYRGWREHLGFALIGSASSDEAAAES